MLLKDSGFKLKPWENMLCTEIVSDTQNNFCTKHVLPHVLQKEELQTKIYLYTSISNLILIEGDDLRSETDFETDSSESRFQGSQCIFFISFVTCCKQF